MGYITNFIVYTLAMVGVIVFALLIFKNATTIGGGKSSKYLKVIDTISLGQRKNLYIVSTGKEQFLIAGDVNSTCLISKLDSCVNENIVNSQTKNSDLLNNIKPITDSFKNTLESLPKQNYMDKSNIGIHSSMISNNQKTTNKSVIKNIAEILK